MRSLLMVGRTFSASSRGTLTRTVSPLASELMTRTCSQRSEDDEVDEDLDEPEDDCATTPKGVSNKGGGGESRLGQETPGTVGHHVFAARHLSAEVGHETLPPGRRRAGAWR